MPPAQCLPETDALHFGELVTLLQRTPVYGFHRSLDDIRLRWLAILHGRVRCSLAATGGVATPDDGIKAILAGAHAVQMVSAILRHGPSHFAVMRDALQRWMESLEIAHVNDIRGRLGFTSSDVPCAFERAQYIRTLSGWSSWLGYGAYLRSHKDDSTMPS